MRVALIGFLLLFSATAASARCDWRLVVHCAGCTIGPYREWRIVGPTNEHEVCEGYFPGRCGGRR